MLLKGMIMADSDVITTSSESHRWRALLWRAAPILLFLIGTLSIALTQRGIGFTWDEAYYFDPSRLAGDWIGEVVRGNHPFGDDAIKQYWSSRAEHPSIQKLLSGMALRTFSDPRRYVVMRLPMAVLFGLTLSLIFLIGRRCWGNVAGLFAAILYAMLPRVFGHSHLATLEPPLLFMTVLVVYCFICGLESPWWAVATGVAFGLLLDTKINGFFLPIPLVLWAHLYTRPRYLNNLFSLVTLGPITMVAAWPWLWHDTPRRILEYLMFHTEHKKTAVYFMGLMWGDQHTAPWFYPTVIIAVSVPLTILLCMILGVARPIAHPKRRPFDTLMLFCVIVMLAVASAPGTPKYDGERLFLTVFPFLALLGGSALAALLARIEKPNTYRIACAATAFVLLLDGGIAIGRYHPFLLSYFNPLVGGLPGAAKRFEVIYWGEALNEDTIRAINQLPDGANIKGLAMNDDCLGLLKDWGLIKPTIKLGGRPPYFDYHILQMRRGMFSRIERTLVETGIFPAVYYQQKMGVPLIAIYKTGVTFEPTWRSRSFAD